MQFSVHTAKTRLSQLIAAALRGEEVVIARGSKPVVRLVPVAQSGFRLGVMAGELGDAPDFLEPMDGAELDLWDGSGT